MKNLNPIVLEIHQIHFILRTKILLCKEALKAEWLIVDY